MAPDSFLLLVATILDSVSASQPASDAVLLRLHALFGPMLTSALQLIDKREVVKVKLPGGRHVWQVTGSTGLPYTIYAHFPSQPQLAADPAESADMTGEDSQPDRGTSPTPAPTDGDIDMQLPSTPGAQVSSHLRQAAQALVLAEKDKTSALRKAEGERAKYERVMQIAGVIERMYCPCAGFMFNSMGGSRNVLCKHLLAIVLANYCDKAVGTQVRFDGVIDLLGLRNMSLGSTGVAA